MDKPSSMSSVEHVEADGTLYELPLSTKPSDQNGGYAGVFKPAGGRLFHARTTLKPGGGQTVLHGAGCASAQEAALRLAKFKAAPYDIEKKNEDRAPKGSKVRAPHSPSFIQPRCMLPCADVRLCRTEAQSCIQVGLPLR